MEAPLHCYKTVSSLSEGLYAEKGSKFIAYAVNCENEDELKKIIELYKTQHPKSRHVCYAWKSSPFSDLSRSSDDGEPSGTAGKPMLNQLESNELFETAIVCIRYFGGIKLGSSGLIKAYKTAAKLALEKASFLQKDVYISYQIESLEENIFILHSILKNLGVRITEIESHKIFIQIVSSVHLAMIQKIKMRFEKNQYEPTDGEFVLLHCKVVKL